MVLFQLNLNLVLCLLDDSPAFFLIGGADYTWDIFLSVWERPEDVL